MVRRARSGRGGHLERWAFAVFAAALSACSGGGYDVPIRGGDDVRFVGEERLLFSHHAEPLETVTLFDLARHRASFRVKIPYARNPSISNNAAFAIFLEPSYPKPGPGARVHLLDLARGSLHAVDVWLKETEDESRELEFAEARNHVSDDGAHVAAFVSQEFRIYDCRTARLEFRQTFPDVGEAPLVRFEPGGLRVALQLRIPGDESEVRVFRPSAGTWEPEATLRGHGATWTAQGLDAVVPAGAARLDARGLHVNGPGFTPSSPSFSKDGRYVGSDEGQAFRIYDLEHHRELLPIPTRVLMHVFQGDRLLAFYENGELWQHDLRSSARRKLRSFGRRADTYRIPFGGSGVEQHYSVLLGENGRFLAYLTGYTEDRELRVYPVADFEAISPSWTALH